MGGASEIVVLLAVLVAIEAARAGVCRRNSLETENLGLVSAAFDVRFAWPMARFAALPFGTLLRLERDGVGRCLEILVKVLCRHIFVACLAGFRADI